VRDAHLEEAEQTVDAKPKQENVMRPLQLFDIEELERLDAHQLALLKVAIEREIDNSPEIATILKAKVRPIYDRLTPRNSPQPAGGSGSGTAPAAGSPPPPSGSP
jgi:hypothetical protein